MTSLKRSTINSLMLLGTLNFVWIENVKAVIKTAEEHPNFPAMKSMGYECGQSRADRIFGGHEATLGQFPWMARLGYLDYENSEMWPSYECGGVIISPFFVLTAAHCSSAQISMQLAVVLLGEHDSDLAKTVDCKDSVCAPESQEIPVLEERCHMNYTPDKKQDDICLLLLENEIKFNEFVKPICLPLNPYYHKDFVGEIMEVAGWGLTPTGAGSSVLLTLKVPIIPISACKREFDFYATIGDNQICAGGELGRDTCGGDSGGPLMRPFGTRTQPPKYFLIGIISFGDQNCGTKPAVYTKVYKYWKWILDNITI